MNTNGPQRFSVCSSSLYVTLIFIIYLLRWRPTNAKFHMPKEPLAAYSVLVQTVCTVWSVSWVGALTPQTVQTSATPKLVNLRKYNWPQYIRGDLILQPSLSVISKPPRLLLPKSFSIFSFFLLFVLELPAQRQEESRLILLLRLILVDKNSKYI